MLIRTIIMGIAGVCAATQARADELQARVLAAARATRTDGYGFQQTTMIDRTGAARKTLVERYDPRRPAAERWSLVSVDGQPPSTKDVAQIRKVKRGPVPSYAELAQWFGAPATRSDTAPGYATYRFARLPAGVIKIGSHDASPDTAAEAVVNVKGATPFVERVRFTSNTGFRMMMVVSVRSIDVTSRYRLLPGGTPVLDVIASTMAGSMLGKAGEIRTSMAFDGFQPVK